MLANLKLSQAEAIYRTSLLRILRAAGVAVDNAETVKGLSLLVEDVGRHCPGIVARGIDQLLDKAAKSQERAEWAKAQGMTHGLYVHSAQSCREAAERILGLFGIEVFHENGPVYVVNGITRLDLLGAIREAVKPS